jgi:uncharacterized protein YndB with AHSA1/START domain
MALWWGPRNTRVERAEADARVGGRFRVVMREDDGERHEVSGTYSVVEPGRRLAFSWAWVTTPERESRVTVSFLPVDGGTEVTLIHEGFADQAARDGHEGGWSEAFERLAEALEGAEAAA